MNSQQNERFYVIEDIRPCAKHHFLVVSKKHIRDCNALTHDDLDLCYCYYFQLLVVNEMELLGNRILDENGATGKRV